MQKIKNIFTFDNINNVTKFLLRVMKYIQEFDFSIFFFRCKLILVFLFIWFFSFSLFSFKIFLFFLLVTFFFFVYLVFFPHTFFLFSTSWSLVKIFHLFLVMFLFYHYETIFCSLFSFSNKTEFSFFHSGQALDPVTLKALFIMFFFFSSLLFIVLSEAGEEFFTTKFISLVVMFSLSFLFFLFLFIFYLQSWLIFFCYLFYMACLSFILYTGCDAKNPLSEKAQDDSTVTEAYLTMLHQIVRVQYGFSFIYLSSLFVSQFIVLNYEIHLKNLSFWWCVIVVLFLFFILRSFYKKGRLLHFFALLLSLIVFRTFFYSLVCVLTPEFKFLLLLIVVLLTLGLFAVCFLSPTFLIGAIRWFAKKTLGMESWQFVLIIIINGIFILISHGSIDILPAGVSLMLFGIEVPETRCAGVFCKKTLQSQALPTVFRRGVAMTLNPTELAIIYNTLGEGAPAVHIGHTPGSQMPVVANGQDIDVILYTRKANVQGFGKTTLIDPNRNFRNNPEKQYVTKQKYTIPFGELHKYVQVADPHGFEAKHQAQLDAAHAAASLRKTPLIQAKKGYNP